MGALTTVALIPNLIFSLHAGGWVDRRGGRRQMMLVADLVRGLLIGTIPVAYALGHLTWVQLYMVAFGTGALSVFFYVAYGGFFQTIVDARGLRRRQLTDPRQPRVLVPRRHEHRRRARPALQRPVRARDRRGVVLLVGAVPRPDRRADPPGANRRKRRRPRRRALDPRATRSSARSCSASRRSTSSTSSSSPCSCSTRRGRWTSVPRRSASCSEARPSGR